jgi:PEP-CTERM motif
MKKLILAAFALTTAASVFAQGTIVFNNRLAGAYVQHVYAPLAPGSSVSQIGNGTADLLGGVAGSTSWAGFSLIGVALTGQYGASSTMAQLLVGNGNSQPELSLTPATPVITFRSGAAAGFTMGNVTATAANVTAGPATIEMVAWDNSSGLYPSWVTADVAWKAGLIAAGRSAVWNDTLGGFGAPPGAPPNMQAQSFNLYFIPEPSTFALAGLGLAALVAFRRRNS